MAPRSFARWLLALAALFCVASTASAAVLGIDYGSEYVKVSIVAPGRTPISIVINEISKRKSTAAVAFTGGDRWLAEEAMNYNARFPDRVFTRLRDLLGKETAVDSFTRYLDKYKLPFKVTADAERATARIVTESGEAYLVEELVAMILQYAMKIGEGMGKGQIKVRRSRMSLPPARRARRAAAIGRSVGNARSNGHPSSTFFFRRRFVFFALERLLTSRFRSRSNPPLTFQTPPFDDETETEPEPERETIDQTRAGCRHRDPPVLRPDPPLRAVRRRGHRGFEHPRGGFRPQRRGVAVGHRQGVHFRRYVDHRVRHGRDERGRRAGAVQHVRRQGGGQEEDARPV
jgi:hypothetical protein